MPKLLYPIISFLPVFWENSNRAASNMKAHICRRLFIIVDEDGDNETESVRYRFIYSSLSV